MISLLLFDPKELPSPFTGISSRPEGLGRFLLLWLSTVLACAFLGQEDAFDFHQTWNDWEKALLRTTEGWCHRPSPTPKRHAFSSVKCMEPRAFKSQGFQGGSGKNILERECEIWGDPVPGKPASIGAPS
jgi:hypothetical protein